jgi:hypothetical protein
LPKVDVICELAKDFNASVTVGAVHWKDPKKRLMAGSHWITLTMMVSWQPLDS